MIVKDLQLYKEDDRYYLKAILFHEDKKGYYEITIPKIKFPISNHASINTETTHDIWYGTQRTAHIDFGFGGLEIIPDKSTDTFYTSICLEEKVHKMTLAEIEKELGYKIELKKEN
jgi:hypothetical protein